MEDSKQANKLFMDNPNIAAGWLDLNINNDITISVSYLNACFFYDLLSIVNILSHPDFGSENLILDIDCEGVMASLQFKFFNETYCPDSQFDYEEVIVTVTKEFYDPNLPEHDGLTKLEYKIDRYTLIWELIELVEKNYEKYNIDFCCGDIADTISLDYINLIKDNLGFKYKKENQD